ncbi:MAG: hypothetical protein L0287_37175 [Anaerolineae bacterium]|nr:hypothetical protein [Anaerolineae bacterium]
MFEDEFLQWIFDQLLLTGYFDVSRVRALAQDKHHATRAITLFNLLPPSEREEITARYAALGVHRKST